MGESLAELQRDIEGFQKAFKKPTLFEKMENGKEILVEDSADSSS